MLLTGASVRRRAGYPRGMEALEAFFIGLLVASAILITWFAGYVVYKLYRGQR